MAINDVPVVVDFVVHRDAMVWPMVAGRRQQRRDPGRARHRAGLGPGGAEPHEPSTRCPSWSRTSPVSSPASPACSRGAASTSTRSRSGPTEHPDISRMTIVVNVEELPLEQVTKQLNKLVNVLKIVELEPGGVGPARAAAGQGPGRPADPLARPRDRAAVPRQGRRRLPRRRHHRGDRQRATSSRRCCGSWSRSASRSSSSPAWSPSAAAPRSITDRALRSA